MWVRFGAAMALLSGACLAGFFSTGPITDIDAGEFKKSVLHGDQVSVVMFYANWCPFSKQMRPEYEKLGEALKSSRLKLYGIDCGDYYNYNWLCKRFGILDYPDMFVFVPSAVAKTVPTSMVLGPDTKWKSHMQMRMYEGNAIMPDMQNYLEPLNSAYSKFLNINS